MAKDKKKDKDQDKKTNWFFIAGALIAAVVSVVFAFLAGRDYVSVQDDQDDQDDKDDQDGKDK